MSTAKIISQRGASTPNGPRPQHDNQNKNNKSGKNNNSRNNNSRRSRNNNKKKATKGFVRRYVTRQMKRYPKHSMSDAHMICELVDSVSKVNDPNGERANCTTANYADGSSGVALSFEPQQFDSLSNETADIEALKLHYLKMKASEPMTAQLYDSLTSELRDLRIIKEQTMEPETLEYVDNRIKNVIDKLKVTEVKPTKRLNLSDDILGTAVDTFIIVLNWVRITSLVIRVFGGGKVGKEQRIAICETLNSITNVTEMYAPGYVVVERFPNIHLTFIPNEGLKNLPEPDELSVSDSVAQIRNIGTSVKVAFNTPYIDNAGLAVVAEYPANVSLTDVTPGNRVAAPLIAESISPTETNITWQIRNTEDTAGKIIEPVQFVGFGSISRTVLNSVYIRSDDNSFQLLFTKGLEITVSQILSTPFNLLEIAGGGNAITFELLHNSTHTEKAYIDPDAFLPSQESTVYRAYLPSFDTAELMIADPKAVMMQLNECQGGIYTVCQTQNPKMLWMKASERNIIRFYTDGMTSKDLGEAGGKLEDIPTDNNLKQAVIALVDATTSFKPGITTNRNMDIVPVAGSIFGPVSKIATEPIDIIDEATRLFCEYLPHTMTLPAAGHIEQAIEETCEAAVSMASVSGSSIIDVLKDKGKSLVRNKLSLFMQNIA